MFGTTGSIFGTWPNAGAQNTISMKMSTDMPHDAEGREALRPARLRALFRPGGAVSDKPLELKKLRRDRRADSPRGRSAAQPSDGTGDNAFPGAAGAAADLSLAGRRRPGATDRRHGSRRPRFPAALGHATIGRTIWGPRPPGGPSDDQLKGLADTANEIGMRTQKYGVRLSLHAHMWGPMEREHDFRRVMELTDPNYVYLILDTGHNVLGGMDVVKMSDEFFPRITEFHLKDTFPQYRGNKEGPTPDMHREKSVYASVGQGGGVDFPGVFAVMRKNHFKGWAVFDIDAPRPGDGTGSVDDNIAASVRYMRDVLKVNLPPPPAKGLFTEA